LASVGGIEVFSLILKIALGSKIRVFILSKHVIHIRNFIISQLSIIPTDIDTIDRVGNGISF
jgi:hypothetical protein